MKTLAILGSTGSIGLSSLKVYEKNKSKFNLIFLAANKNLRKLINQKKKYKPKKIFLFDKGKIKKNLQISNIKEIYRYKKKIDYIISGVSGIEGIEINLKLLKICKNLLIANKETIICGGKVFLNEARKNKCNILPIDSEHFCLDFFLKNFTKKIGIKRIFLTASGGPFLKKKIKYDQSLKTVLKHPNWKMGDKITVDSSTFSNKVLELFEAKMLFNLNPSKIKIIVENKSNVHSVIELENNIIFQVLHTPNMQIPISNSLNVRNNFKFKLNKLSIDFLDPNIQKFPIIALGYKILNKFEDSGMIYFTVINERLVERFLKNKIKYGEISKILVKIFKQKEIINKSCKKIRNYKDIVKTIIDAKNIRL